MMKFIKLTLIAALLGFLILLPEISLGQSDTSSYCKKMEKKFFESNNLLEKQKIFEELIRNYPQDIPKNSQIDYDGLRRVLALNYLVDGDTIKFRYTINSIRDKEFLSSSLNEVAEHWSRIKPLQSAALLAAKTAVFTNDSLLNNLGEIKTINIEKKNELTIQKIKFTSTYAYVLNNSEQSKKALEVMETVSRSVPETNFRFLEYYSLILASNGFLSQSDEIIIKLLLEGYSSSDLDKQLKENYINKNKGDAGFEKFKREMNSKVRIKLIEKISKSLLNIPAPQFTIKAATGTTVSSKDYVGKVIVIDFWASWCAPCLDMFPTMAELTERYKHNDSVKFIFINTWEDPKQYQDIFQSFISKSKYGFNFLVDEIDKSGKQQKTSNLFSVKALPTKIVIDQYGTIKFIEEGYSGSASHLFISMTTKIDYLLSLPSKKME